ncbi:hypothetical protein WAK64_22225 [Bacillus spongiae]|uniref:DUF3953 domain-containing protein n=1 Tax=Bacillus spongiae TaxID=2683610 RepID=A0ABU8HJZ8_9BACI
MSQEKLLFLLGITSITLAYLPVYPNLTTLIGLFLGITGIILSTIYLRKERTHNRFLKIGRWLCTIGTIMSTYLLLY